VVIALSASTATQKVMLKSMFDQFKKMPNAKPEVFDDMEKMKK
jgi:hypothetical protein